VADYALATRAEDNRRGAVVMALAKRCGFRTFNEIVHVSVFKPHVSFVHGADQSSDVNEAPQDGVARKWLRTRLVGY
jgi:hypothetical protein